MDECFPLCELDNDELGVLQRPDFDGCLLRHGNAISFIGQHAVDGDLARCRDEIQVMAGAYLVGQLPPGPKTPCEKSCISAQRQSLRLDVLREAACEHDEVVRIANSGLLPRFAELAMPVAEAAEHGNEGAKAIIQRAGEELAALAGIVIIRLWPKGGVVRVALSGGVLQGSDNVRQAFQHALRGAYPEAAVSFAHVRPVLGALAIAAGELPAREAAQ